MNSNVNANHASNLVGHKEPARSHPHLNMTNTNQKLIHELQQHSVSAAKRETQTQISKRDVKNSNGFDAKPIAHKPPLQHSLNDIALKKADKAKLEQRSHTIPSVSQANLEIRNYNTVNERDARLKYTNQNKSSETNVEHEKPKVNNLINQFEKVNSSSKSFLIAFYLLKYMV